MPYSAQHALVSVAIFATIQACVSTAPEAGIAYLVSRATLPADTFAAGPPSGAFITGANGQTPPFPGQPVQGISALQFSPKKGVYYGMADNGFGSKANSPDFLLRIYELKPNLQNPRETRTCLGPGVPPQLGKLQVGEFIQLRDPKKVAGFTITREGTPERFLTGADFDVESLQRMPDGSFWIGDELGPFLLHFSKNGVLLSPPIPNGDLKSPSNPFLNGAPSNMGSSRGYEAMAKSMDSKMLYPILEGQLLNETTAADGNVLRRWIYEFNVKKKVFTGNRWQYKTDQHPIAGQDVFISDAQCLDGANMLVLERDNFDGGVSKRGSLFIKRIYKVNRDVADADGYLVKTLVADLLQIRDGSQISNDGTGGYGLVNWDVKPIFQYSLVSVESILPLSNTKIMLINDNNFPFDSSRIEGKPDGTEMIVIKVAPLMTD